MREPDSDSWFALQVVPRCEQKVAKLLEYKGYELLLPTYQVSRRWSDRLKVLNFPLFPGYLFCCIRSVSCGLIRSTPGVIRIVGTRGNPSPICDQEMNAVRRIADLGSGVCPHPYLRLKQRVMIQKGPLRGVVGMLVEVSNRRRLVISVDTIMKSVSMNVDASDVTPLD
jgi:transcriptional antiterminator NusG